MKFGGSSIESASALKRVVSIIRDHLERQPVVVVSAMGKTTDRLLSLTHKVVAGREQEASHEMARLRQFHATESGGFGATHPIFEDLEKSLAKLRAAGWLSPALSDEVLSAGERLSSVILTAALRRAGMDPEHLDSRYVIITDDRHTCAEPLMVETSALLRRRISRQTVTVMGGFIGATENGCTTTLGRGGSDYTAAIVGAALAAEEVQIWTDVDGMLTCDPRIVSGGHCLRSISYEEARLMAEAGAKVLHPSTVTPAIRQRIPITIRNSRNPSAAGTRICEMSRTDGQVMSLACRTGMLQLRISSPAPPITADFGQAVWEAFRRAGVFFQLLAASDNEFTILIGSDTVTEPLSGDLASIARMRCQPVAVVTAVGRNASRNPRNLQRAARALGDITIDCRADSRFSMVVPEAALMHSMQALHDEFFSSPDAALFVPSRYSEIAEPRPEGSRSSLRTQPANS